MTARKPENAAIRMRKVMNMRRCEKWELQMWELTEKGIISAAPSGGNGRQWKLMKPDDIVQAPVLFFPMSGAIIQGGKRIKGFGLYDAIHALNIDLSEEE